MKIKRCPNCKSDRIEVYAALVTGSYYCRKCGYIGPLVIEEEVNKLNER